MQDKPRFKKRVSNKVPSHVPKMNKDRVLTLSTKRLEEKIRQVINKIVPSVVRGIKVSV